MKHLKLLENFDIDDVVYHGTSKAFSNFKVGSAVSNPMYGKSAPDHGLGIFFTDNLTMTKWFAGMVDYDNNVK